MKPLRIAIECRSCSGRTGASRLVLETTRRLIAAGNSVDIVVERGDTAAIRATGAQVRWVKPWPLGSRWRCRRFAAGSAKLMRHGYDLRIGNSTCADQDILLFHNCIRAAHEWIPGSEPADQVPVVELHDTMLRQQRFRALIANSALMRDDLIARYAVPADLISVIHPAVDLARFRPVPRGAPTATVGFITSGDFAKRNLAGFLRLMHDLRHDHPHLRALIVGRGDVPAEPWIEHLPNTDAIEQQFARIDMLVHPAHFEEFGMVVAEALACGVPVVTSARVGASTLCVSAPVPLIAADPSQLIPLVRRLLDNPTALAACAAWAPTAVANLGWDDYARKLMAVFQQLH